MIIKEVLAPQTCTNRQQVSKAVPKQGRLHNDSLHMNRENKNLKSRKKTPRVDE